MAQRLGLSYAAVYNWCREKQDGGRGGLIPSKHIPALIKLAFEDEIELTPQDFFRGHY